VRKDSFNTRLKIISRRIKPNVAIEKGSRRLLLLVRMIRSRILRFQAGDIQQVGRHESGMNQGQPLIIDI